MAGIARLAPENWPGAGMSSHEHQQTFVIGCACGVASVILYLLSVSIVETTPTQPEMAFMFMAATTWAWILLATSSHSLFDIGPVVGLYTLLLSILMLIIGLRIKTNFDIRAVKTGDEGVYGANTTHSR